jgi:NADPH:quinone reductase-like Zn-dependent oxidoreductase
MAPSVKNDALYVDEDGAIVIQDMRLPEVPDNEVLIRVTYSGVNPSDTRILMFFDPRRRVLGNEFTGEVLDSPGLAGTQFKVGDIVAGYTSGSADRPIRYGSHQEYLSVPPSWIYKLPSDLPQPEAAALTIVTMTANDILFNRLRIPPPYEVSGPTEGSLVIWGAATSVGMAAVQLARASGVTTIIVTASPKRHELLKSLGATHCFDYNDEAAIDSIKALLCDAGNGPIWAADAIGTVTTPDSQTQLLSAIPVTDNRVVSLVTVLLTGHDGFEGSLGGRHEELSLDMPGGQKLVIPARPDEAAVMWKSLYWAVEHYGKGFHGPPVTVFKGTANAALEEVKKVGELGMFGKLVLARPWDKEADAA